MRVDPAVPSTVDTREEDLPMTVAGAKCQLREIRSTLVAVPAAYPIVSSVRHTDHVINVIVELETEAGITGRSYVAAFSLGQGRAIRSVLDELSEQLQGFDVLSTGAMWDKACQLLRLGGLGGLNTFALSALDLAAWDVLGIAAGAPVHRLLGTRRERLPAYGSDACWLGGDPQRVAEEAATLAADFSAIKVRFGRPNPKHDLAALDAVLDAVDGDRVTMNVDVNQGWDRATAAFVAPELMTRGVRWLEEPLASDDTEGLADLRERTGLQIVAGESRYLPAGLAGLVDARAVSMLMPDVQRVGGVTGWIRAAAYAEVSHIPLTSHLFPEFSVHLLAAAENPGPLEWVTWLHPVLENPLAVEGGYVQVPQAPGWGLRFSSDAIDQFRVE